MSVSYPIAVSVPEPERLSRWQVLFKWWLFVIPHWIVLAFLWAGAVVAWIAAFFTILFTGRYPQSLFRYMVGVERWTFRVGSYMWLLRDEYPPFSFTREHPAQYNVEYPERLSRGLVLVKWWLLAIPHYLLGFLLAGAGNLLALFNGVVILFTGHPHSAIFRLVRGILCWATRAYSYAALLTDRYPPFSLEESESAAAESLPVSPLTAVVLIVIGVIGVVLIAAAAVASVAAIGA